jgi:hypothetical protein
MTVSIAGWDISISQARIFSNGRFGSVAAPHRLAYELPAGALASISATDGVCAYLHQLLGLNCTPPHVKVGQFVFEIGHRKNPQAR